MPHNRDAATNAWQRPWKEAKIIYRGRYESIKARLTFSEKFAFSIFCNDPTLEHIRTRLFKPIAILAIKNNITANQISIIGALIIAFTVLFSSNPTIISIAIIFNLFCDGLDGVVARTSGNANSRGATLDIICDSFASTCITLATSALVGVPILTALSLIISLWIYTYLMALKNRILFGRPLVIGCRVITSILGVFICLVLQFGMDITLISPAITLAYWTLALLITFGNIQVIFQNGVK